MTSDLMMVVGSGTYADMGATYRNTSVDRSALDRVMELTSGVRVSAHVPARGLQQPAERDYQTRNVHDGRCAYLGRRDPDTRRNYQRRVRAKS